MKKIVQTVLCLMFLGSVTSFAGIMFQPNNIVEFKVNLTPGMDAEINWTTNDETKLDYFILEKSQDGKFFDMVEKITANGVSEEISSYIYYDNNLGSGMTYYRLRQVRDDGRHNVSLMIEVENEAPAALALFPNPATSTMNLQLEDDGALSVEIFRFATGKKMTTYYMNGETSATLPVHELENGQYWLRVKYPNKTQSIRFIKK